MDSRGGQREAVGRTVSVPSQSPVQPQRQVGAVVRTGHAGWSQRGRWSISFIGESDSLSSWFSKESSSFCSVNEKPRSQGPQGGKGTSKMAEGVRLSQLQPRPLTLTQSLVSGSRHSVPGALAGPVWLAVLASCRGGQGQTHVPGVFSWLALESLQALGGLALEVPLAGQVSSQGLTMLPLMGG